MRNFYIMAILIASILLFSTCVKLSKVSYPLKYTVTDSFSIPRFTKTQVAFNIIQQPITIENSFDGDINKFISSAGLTINDIDTLLIESIVLSFYEDSITNSMNYFNYINIKLSNEESNLFTYKYTSNPFRAFFEKGVEKNLVDALKNKNIKLTLYIYINGASELIGYLKSVPYKIEYKFYLKAKILKSLSE